MPTTTSAEQSLINGSEFLDELGQFSNAAEERVVQPLEQRETYLDAFEALDSGLPADANALVAESPRRGHAAIEEFDELPANRPTREERRISFMTAALVLLACLTAGAVTAAYVFQDRLTPVTARPSATR
jgi:hypothetical protein